MPEAQAQTAPGCEEAEAMLQTVTKMFRRLRRAWWSDAGPFLPNRWRYVPLAVSLVLVAVGLHMRFTIERAVRTELRKQLETILQAAVAGLELWIDSQFDAAGAMAAHPRVVEQAAALVDLSRGEGGRDALLQSSAARELREQLGGVLTSHGFRGYLVVGPGGTHLASDRGELVGFRGVGERTDVFTRALRGEVALSIPFLSFVPLPDEGGTLRAQKPTMFLAAPIKTPDGGIIAALGVRIAPEEEFSRVLTTARSGETGETYAFDGNGLMISRSRFEDDLRKIALLPERSDVHSILNVPIRDPGVNLLQHKRSERFRSERSLTRMAAAAVQGETGSDVDGYRDYRGVPVIGAWTWLPRHRFGITTEVDVDEAYRPLKLLQISFLALFGLLVLAAIATLFFSRSVLILRGRMRDALREVQRLGQYRLEAKIGSGGLGEVYRASHVLLRRPTAVKLLHPERHSPQEIQRFEQEVILASQLSHPNTIRIYDYGVTPEGIFYFAMEYLPGSGVDRLVEIGGALPAGRVIHILLQVCASLQEAHEMGIIHRDLKPANLILCERGGIYDFVVVVDFGLAKNVQQSGKVGVTNPKFAVGTPRYLAPEAVRSEGELDRRSDIYSLGAVAYYLLTGQELFEGDSVLEVIRHHLHDAPILPSQRLGRRVSSDLESVIMCCLEKDPERRPQNVQELAHRLRMCRDAGTWTERLARKWWEQFGERMESHPERASTNRKEEPGHLGIAWRRP